MKKIKYIFLNTLMIFLFTSCKNNNQNNIENTNTNDIIEENDIDYTSFNEIDEKALNNEKIIVKIIKNNSDLSNNTLKQSETECAIENGFELLYLNYNSLEYQTFVEEYNIINENTYYYITYKSGSLYIHGTSIYESLLNSYGSINDNSNESQNTDNADNEENLNDTSSENQNSNTGLPDDNNSNREVCSVDEICS